MLAEVDLNGARKRLNDDATILAEVIRAYIEYTPFLLEELDRQLQEGDLPAYAVTVHGIKSSSRSIGAMSAGDAAQELELAAKGGDDGKVQATHAVFLGSISTLIKELQEFGYE
jgi:HPt (histidine-containing phosphotransfer) domain-containing protein